MTSPRAGTGHWRVAEDRALTLDQPVLMGILNVAPDSFFDGGRHADAEAGMEAALRMVDEGAAIIDVGGESTRPGADAVLPREQIRRTIPVIAGLRRQSTALISIDTTSSQVAQAALDVGANIINDVSAGTDDGAMLPLAAARKCGIVLMHRLRRPRDDRYSHDHVTPPDYADDVVNVVCTFLAQRVEAASRAGVRREAIVLDPGLGFGKNVPQNYELVGRFDEVLGLGFPVLAAASRKSFIGAVGSEAPGSAPLPPSDRLPGTLAVHLLLWQRGARLFRVHDVAAHRQMFAAASAASRGTWSPARTLLPCLF